MQKTDIRKPNLNFLAVLLKKNCRFDYQCKYSFLVACSVLKVVFIFYPLLWKLFCSKISYLLKSSASIIKYYTCYLCLTKKICSWLSILETIPKFIDLITRDIENFNRRYRILFNGSKQVKNLSYLETNC